MDGLVEAYSGRGQALAEMGRQRGTCAARVLFLFSPLVVEEPGADTRRLPRQAETLKAALADARAAADG